MTRRRLRHRPGVEAAEETNAWLKFTTGELETKLAELRKLVDSGVLSDRSLNQQFTEIGIIENELARRYDD